jgi:hypothetical protein
MRVTKRPQGKKVMDVIVDYSEHSTLAGLGSI